MVKRTMKEAFFEFVPTLLISVAVVLFLLAVVREYRLTMYSQHMHWLGPEGLIGATVEAAKLLGLAAIVEALNKKNWVEGL